MRKLLVFLFTLAVFATLESTLEDDERTPSGFSEQVALKKKNTDVTKFEELYSKLSENDKKVLPLVDRRSLCGKVKQQSETSQLTDVGCGSCTAFAVIAGAEMAYRVATGKKEIFSEMEIVDCMYHAGGCNGNNREQAVMHVFNYGVAKNADYPYEPHDKKICNKKPTRHHIHKFVPFAIDHTKPEHWKTFIKKYGGFTMSYYSGPLRFEPKGEDNDAKTVCVDCVGASAKPESTNHAVFVAGYGTMDGKEYFLIRNSWGEGACRHDRGYIRIEVGKCNNLARDFHGFVFDQCDMYKDKKTCEARPECKFQGLFGKCTSAFVKFETLALDGAEALANVADNIVDALDGVGIQDLSTGHALRKDGTEFFAHLKLAKKSGSVKKVQEWFDKAVANKAVYASNGRVRDHKKLRELLGLKNDVTTHVACKAHDDDPSKTDRNNWYTVLDGKMKKKPGDEKKYKTYYDPRFNRVDYEDLHSIIGTTVNGKFTYRTETSGGFGRDDLTDSEKKLYSSELICYARAGKKRVKNDAFFVIKHLPDTIYDSETKKIKNYTDLKTKFSITTDVKTFKCSNDSNLWFYKEGDKYWNCKTNKFEELPSTCTEYTPPATTPATNTAINTTAPAKKK